MVFKSAWIPAPPPESDPATVKTRGIISKFFPLLIDLRVAIREDLGGLWFQLAEELIHGQHLAQEREDLLFGVLLIWVSKGPDCASESPISLTPEKGMDPPDVVAFLEFDGFVFRSADNMAIQHEGDMIRTRLLHQAFDHGFVFLRFPDHLDYLGKPGSGSEIPFLVINLHLHGQAFQAPKSSMGFANGQVERRG
jgi:hypothetical protein